MKTRIYLFILGLALAPISHAEKCVMKGTLYENVWHPDCIPLKPGESVPERPPLQVPGKDNHSGTTATATKIPSTKSADQTKGYGIFQKNAQLCINLGKTIVASAAGSHSLKQAQSDFKRQCDPNKQLQSILDKRISEDVAISPLDWSKLSPP